jgi:hypothetical protein
MRNQLFEHALAIAKPWYVEGVDFDADNKTLTISVDFVAGTRFRGRGLGDAVCGTRCGGPASGA